MTDALIDTREKILIAARATVQARGYAGLSFRDLAKEVGIKSASVHYHFPTKGELGGVLAHKYTDDFAEYLDGLLAEGLDQRTLLDKYTDVFRITLSNENRMCLGGIMAAEYTELPAEVQAEILRFSEMNVRWLTQVLSIKAKAKSGDEAIRLRALSIFAAIEGAQLVARGRSDITIYESIVRTYRTTGLIP